MRVRPLLPLAFALGCSASEGGETAVEPAGPPAADATPESGSNEAAGPQEAAPPADAAPEGSRDATGTDAGHVEGGDAKGDAAHEAAGDGAHDAASHDAPVVPPPGTECEYAFFRHYFDKDNGSAYAALRDATFLHIVDQVNALHACGAKITLGGMLSLMIYEGAGAKVAFYNDKCSENSYDKSATCWTNPKARYSYQYGLAPVHTSNFHPCADVGYTSKMRTRLATAMSAAGFSPSASQIASVTGELHAFCPSSSPTMVDYYVITAHSAFDVPKNGTGNDLKNADKYPFFAPRVVIDVFFGIVSGGGSACASLTSDNAAIAVFGGGDASYKSPAKQEAILKLWKDFQQANCK
jgi:hypothetical protein